MQPGVVPDRQAGGDLALTGFKQVARPQARRQRQAQQAQLQHRLDHSHTESLRRDLVSTRAAANGSAPTSPPWAASDARLVLEDGSVWPGNAFGASGTAVAEVVFNTSLTGYQEILTDPSYRGQYVVFTHPHIGNTGINPGESCLTSLQAAGSPSLWQVYSPRHQHGPLNLASALVCFP